MPSARIPVLVPPLGCLLLAVLADVHDGTFRFVVREDSVLEWAEVFAYAAAAVAGVLVARRSRGLVRLAYLCLAIAASGAIGEELSWGQRLFDITTPASLAAENRQDEINIHNIAGADSKVRLLMLGAALYGVVAPLVLRRGPFVPPRSLAPAFAVVVAYLAYRFLFLPRPSYVQAKFSEWPELCFAGAVALAAWNTLMCLSRGRPGEEPR